MDYEMKYNEALNWMRKVYPTLKGADKEDAEHYFPELSESEDERMLREFNDYLCEEIECRTNDLRDEKDRKTLNMLCFVLKKVDAWLEKQKESTDESDKIAAAYQLGLADGRKQKECVADAGKTSENTSASTMIPSCWEMEQNPNIELIQRSWYMEGYHDGKFKQEPKWILKTGEGGPTYELNPRYGQPLAEPSETPSNLDELMDSYFENLQVPEHQIIFEDTYRKIAKDFYGYGHDAKQEWSEEDEDKLYQVMETLLADKTVALRETPHCKALHEAYDEMLAWLKSLRPHWKPSEEQMKALNFAVTYMFSTKQNPTYLRDLYDDLKKLMEDEK